MLLRRVLGFYFAAACVCFVSACPGTADDTGKKDLGVRDGSADGPMFIDMARNTTSCVGGGAVCSSSNPGACDKGTVTCDGTLAMCTPDSMLQDCYDGIAGTQGVGVCTSGKQSCIGILGACLGQILPATQENCLNDLDDDCDGKVNNGCPDTLITGTPRLLTLAGMSTNANQMSVDARCPQDAFVIGVDIGFYDTDLSVTQLILTCGKGTLTRPTSGTIYTLGIAPVTPAPYVTYEAMALTSGMSEPGACSTSLTSLRAVITANGKYDNGGYFAMYTQCGLGSGILQADNSLSINFSLFGSPKGFGYGGITPAGSPSWACASNEVVIGFKGKATTTSIDQLQPICAPLIAKPKP